MALCTTARSLRGETQMQLIDEPLAGLRFIGDEPRFHRGFKHLGVAEAGRRGVPADAEHINCSSAAAEVGEEAS